MKKKRASGKTSGRTIRASAGKQIAGHGRKMNVKTQGNKLGKSGKAMI